MTTFTDSTTEPTIRPVAPLRDEDSSSLATEDVFIDPVGYLARLGISAEIVPAIALPAAA